AVALDRGRGLRDDDGGLASERTRRQRDAKPVIARRGGHDLTAGRGGERGAGTPQLERAGALEALELEPHALAQRGRRDQRRAPAVPRDGRPRGRLVDAHLRKLSTTEVSSAAPPTRRTVLTTASGNPMPSIAGMPSEVSRSGGGVGRSRMPAGI